MKYIISMHYTDGTVEHLKEFNEVDLDYFNIRQWRLLLYKFYSLQAKKYGSLVITPIIDTTF